MQGLRKSETPEARHSVVWRVDWCGARIAPMENQDAFRENLIRYLVKLEIEVRALRRALLQADEPLVTEDQMTTFLGQEGSDSAQIAALIRRELGLPV